MGAGMVSPMTNLDAKARQERMDEACALSTTVALHGCVSAAETHETSRPAA